MIKNDLNNEIKTININELKINYYLYNENSEFLILENDLKLDSFIIKNFKNYNYSYILNLRTVMNTGNLNKYIQDFVSTFLKLKNNKPKLLIYTTGTDIKQIYDYTLTAIENGIKTMHFYFNEYNIKDEKWHKEILEFFKWLRNFHIEYFGIIVNKKNEIIKIIDYNLLESEIILEKDFLSIFKDLKNSIKKKYKIDIKDYWIPNLKNLNNSIMLITELKFEKLNEKEYKKIQEIENYINSKFSTEKYKYYILS